MPQVQPTTSFYFLYQYLKRKQGCLSGVFSRPQEQLGISPSQQQHGEIENVISPSQQQHGEAGNAPCILSSSVAKQGMPLFFLFAVKKTERLVRLE